MNQNGSYWWWVRSLDFWHSRFYLLYVFLITSLNWAHQEGFHLFSLAIIPPCAQYIASQFTTKISPTFSYDFIFNTQILSNFLFWAQLNSSRLWLTLLTFCTTYFSFLITSFRSVIFFNSKYTRLSSKSCSCSIIDAIFSFFSTNKKLNSIILKT